jgi:hypothetical protein
MQVSFEDFPANVRVIGVNEFDEAAFDELAPLVIKGAAARATHKWTNKWLIEHFGTASCRVCLDSRPALTDLAFKKYVALSEYLDGQATSNTSNDAPEYLFHPWMERDFEEVADLFRDLDVPPAILDLGEAGKWRLFVGPALSGTLPHFHNYAINALARGQKRWAIYVGADEGETAKLLEEGYRNYGTGSQARDWFAQECPKLRSRQQVQLWEFTQAAGDLVYIPNFFIHAVLNLEPVLGFGVEFFQRQNFLPRRIERPNWVRGQEPMRRTRRWSGP